MALEDLTGASGTAPAAEAQTTQNAQITGAKFRALIDMLDAYMAHTHDFNDEYYSNCQCQCGRGSI